MGQKQSSNTKKFEFKFGYEIIEQPKSFGERVFPVDYTYDKEFPIELINVLNENEYATIGEYLRFLSGNGSPQFQYLQNMLVFVFCFFLPLLMIVNHICLKFISVYLLASASLNLFITFPYLIYLIIKTFKLRRGVNKILNERKVQLKKEFRFNKFAFLYVLIVYLQAGIEVYWFMDYYNHGGVIVNTLIHYLIAFDVFIIFFFIYNYALFSRSRGILTSAFQVGNDEEYIELLNNNINRYMTPLPYYLVYTPATDLTTQLSPNNNINDIDVESQKLLLNPYIYN